MHMDSQYFDENDVYAGNETIMYLVFNQHIVN